MSTQAGFLEPELTIVLQQLLRDDPNRWASLLESIILTYLSSPGLTLADINTPRADYEYLHLQSLPLARLAMRHLPPSNADALMWHTMLADLPALTDEPYHPLFDYGSSSFTSTLKWYLLAYRFNPTFIEKVQAALRDDVPGSSALAYFLIDQGQTVFVSQALRRALQVVRRPEADGDDVLAAVSVLSRYGSEQQRTELNKVAHSFVETNADFGAYLQRWVESRK